MARTESDKRRSWELGTLMKFADFADQFFQSTLLFLGNVKILGFDPHSTGFEKITTLAIKAFFL